MNYTTADLITSIKTRAMVPTSQSTFDAAAFLTLASEEVELGLVPLLMSAREEYFVTSSDFASGSTSYDIPTRAIGMKLRDVVLVNSNGKERRVPRIDPEEKSNYSSSADDPGFWLQGNKVCFTLAPTDTVRLYYFQRPGTLVETTAAAQVTAINSTTSIDVASVPSTFTTSTALDFVKGQPGYDLLSADTTPTSISGTTLTFSSLPSDLAVGDWVALAGESPVIQLPKELHPILAQRVAVKVLEATGDADAFQMAQAKLSSMESAAFRLIEPRVDGEPKKIINHSSPLRRYAPRYKVLY